MEKPQAKSGTENVFWAPLTSHTNYCWTFLSYIVFISFPHWIVNPPGQEPYFMFCISKLVYLNQNLTLRFFFGF